MKSGLSLVLLAMLAVTSVYSLPKISTSDLSMNQLMTKMKEQLPEDTSEESKVLYGKLQAMMEDFDFNELMDSSSESDEETGEIGPNFNSKQFFGMIKRVTEASWQKRCKQISGDDKAYEKAKEAEEEFKTCLEKWNDHSGLDASYNQTKLNGDFKPFMKDLCAQRSGFFECTDKVISTMSKCYFPSEMQYLHKVDHINKHMSELFCSNEADNFALFEPEGDGMKCVQMSMTEIKTCANKAIYSGTQRLLEKWIENEHFNFHFETEDCKVYDEVKSCFVSSVANCTNPKVKDTISSIFQIFRDETSC